MTTVQVKIRLHATEILVRGCNTEIHLAGVKSQKHYVRSVQIRTRKKSVFEHFSRSKTSWKPDYFQLGTRIGIRIKMQTHMVYQMLLSLRKRKLGIWNMAFSIYLFHFVNFINSFRILSESFNCWFWRCKINFRRLILSVPEKRFSAKCF